MPNRTALLMQRGSYRYRPPSSPLGIETAEKTKHHECFSGASHLFSLPIPTFSCFHSSFNSVFWCISIAVPGPQPQACHPLVPSAVGSPRISAAKLASASHLSSAITPALPVRIAYGLADLPSL